MTARPRASGHFSQALALSSSAGVSPSATPHHRVERESLAESRTHRNNTGPIQLWSLRISLCRIERRNNRPQIGIEHNRLALQGFCQRGLGFIRVSSKQIAAVKLNREVGIF